MIRVLVADDHRLFRQGISSLLDEEENVTVVGEAEHGRMALRKIDRLKPDVVLMDVHMPQSAGGTPVASGAEVTRQVLAEHPDVKIIMLTVSEDDADLFAAVRAGAVGYLLKNVDVDELVDAIHRAYAGEAMLSPVMAAKLLREFREVEQRAVPAPEDVLTGRERDVLRELATGATNREIAERLTISTHTVKTHVRHILKKLDVENRAQAAAYAAQHDLLS